MQPFFAKLAKNALTIVFAMILRKTKTNPQVLQCFRAKVMPHPYNTCGKHVSNEWSNHGSRNNIVKCLDCLNPPCSNSACATCKTCRSTTCKSANCSEKPKALNGKELEVFDSLENFVCQACLFPHCSVCKAEMTKKIRQRKRKSKLWISGDLQRTWMCADCEIKANHRSHASKGEQC